jgi:hypothetical protein
VLLAAGSLVAAELAASCPPGGPLRFLGCGPPRALLLGVIGVGMALYVGGLSGVLWWTAGLHRRGVADVRAARDWYLLAAAFGLLVAPLLAFSLLAALR